jgi:hypothetical protein
MNKDGYAIKAFLAVVFGLTFAACALWAVYHFTNENIAATIVGALILSVRDIVGKIYRVVRSNGETPAKPLPTDTT